MARTDKQLLDEVNRSGFPLQIGVERLVRDAGPNFGWRVRYSEHEWEHPRSGQGSFIDLVLISGGENVQLVLECKRVRETSWIFLREQGAPMVTRTRCFLACQSSSRVLWGWEDVHAKLESPESGFCVVIGEKDQSRSLLERIGSNLVQSVEGLAMEDRMNNVFKPGQACVYVPIVVTTANLRLCDYDSSSINLNAGEFGQVNMREVPFLRFRKQLSTTPSVVRAAGVWDPRAIATAKESTVYVVNVNHLQHFLIYLDIDSNSVSRLLPT